MYLYLIRHGQSEANVRGEYCGWSQVALTEKGIADARRAGALLKDISFNKVYASDLKRAIQTCENALPGVPYETDPLLRELYTGSLEGLAVQKAHELYGEPHDLALKNSDFRAYGGETRQMQIDRLRTFLQKMENFAEDEKVAVFCHAGTLFCMMELALDTPFSFDHLMIDNGSVSVFRFSFGIWQLNKWNMT